MSAPLGALLVRTDLFGGFAYKGMGVYHDSGAYQIASAAYGGHGHAGSELAVAAGCACHYTAKHSKYGTRYADYYAGSIGFAKLAQVGFYVLHASFQLFELGGMERIGWGILSGSAGSRHQKQGGEKHFFHGG